MVTILIVSCVLAVIAFRFHQELQEGYHAGRKGIFLQHFDKMLVYPNEYYSSITQHPDTAARQEPLKLYQR
jgi:hypothetical protein